MNTILSFKKDSKPQTLIIGCGRLGANLASRLSDAGNNVTIINDNADDFRKLSPSFGGLTFEGDGTNFELLTAAGINHCDRVVAVTDDDTTNLMVAQIARKAFGVRQVIARINDPERGAVCDEMAIQTICPFDLASQALMTMIADPAGPDSSKGELPL
jgi:trk system potassium uptake protein TrkA